MTQKEILKLLADRNIPFVVIGGVAMRIHNSPRVTHDIDLADVSFKVASVEDLLFLKQQRKEKTGADYDDIRFLEKLLKNSDTS